MDYITQELDTLVDEWISFRYQMHNAKTKIEEDKIELKRDFVWLFNPVFQEIKGTGYLKNNSNTVPIETK